MAITDPDGTIRFTGAVLMEREENWRDDSDGYALVWDAAEGRVKRVETWTTRFAGPFSRVEVDATDAAKEAASAWVREELAQRLLPVLDARARKIEPYVSATVVAGRKIPKGERVDVIRLEANPFRTYYRNGYNRPDNPWNQRALVRRPDGSQAWTAAANLARADVVPPTLEDARHGVRNATYHQAPAVFSHCGPVAV